jgi:hypothetical protein
VSQQVSSEEDVAGNDAMVGTPSANDAVSISDMSSVDAEGSSSFVRSIAGGRPSDDFLLFLIGSQKR